MPAMRPNCRSSGVATDEAMISGLAPGKLACTLIVGKSICGSGATGRTRNARIPARAIAAVRSAVATGRSINGAERFNVVSQYARIGFWGHHPLASVQTQALRRVGSSRSRGTESRAQSCAFYGRHWLHGFPRLRKQSFRRVGLTPGFVGRLLAAHLQSSWRCAALVVCGGSLGVEAQLLESDR